MATTLMHSGRVPTAFPQRRGTVAVLTALFLVLLMGCVALSVDTGLLYINRAQLQTCADAGALAGADSLLSDNLVQAVPNYLIGPASARSAAVQFASLNQVGTGFPAVDSNSTNDPKGDVVIGYMSHPEDPSCPLEFSKPALFNAVQVRVRKTADMNGVVPAIFSRIWGNEGTPVIAKATAMANSSIIGFRVKGESNLNTSLMPFAVNVDDWNTLVGGAGSDNYGYDSNKNVVAGRDGILELNMFPSSTDQHGGITPGNFGTVDVGASSNSTFDLERQILDGVSEQDLSYLGGSLVLGPDGTLKLDGDTGVSTAVKNALEKIKGKPRSILLYKEVVNPGDNATYTIVGFAGVRVMKVHLTGAMSVKSVVVQPAVVMDGHAVTGDGPNQSKYIYSTSSLIR